MSTAIVYAISTTSTTDPNSGLIVRLVEGEPWAADDPFVRSRPELFAAMPERLRRTVPASPIIEQASKAPGEKRTTKRG